MEGGASTRMLQALARRHNMVIVSPILVRACHSRHSALASQMRCIRRWLQAPGMPINVKSTLRWGMRAMKQPGS